MSKKLIILTTLVFVSFIIPAQTLIATSKHQMATANHNQRKIVRDTLDNVYVVFQDIVETDTVIKGLYLNRETEEWSLPIVITSGKNPTLAISKDCKYYLVYESNEALPQIIYRSSQDFFTWTDELNILESIYACKTPVADVDSSGNLNIFWIYGDFSNYSRFMYARVTSDTVSMHNHNFTADVSDISIANHLQYKNDKLFVAIDVDYDDERIDVFSTSDYFETFDYYESFDGTKPSISYNSYYSMELRDAVKILFNNNQNKFSQAYEILDIDFDYSLTQQQVQLGNIEYYCIDDVAHPIGYSYLFMKEGVLYHGFSYGSPDWLDDPQHNIDYEYDIVLDTIATNPLFPSIAYKQFRFSVIDFIWMEQNGDEFNIFYKRDDKYNNVNPYNVENYKANAIYGFPNPFKEKIELSYPLVKNCSLAELSIYDDYGKLLLLKEIRTDNSVDFKFVWDGKDQNGNDVKPGVYVVLFIAGDTKIAGKVVKE
jgi:hypothetical protein